MVFRRESGNESLAGGIGRLRGKRGEELLKKARVPRLFVGTCEAGGHHERAGGWPDEGESTGTL